MGTRIPKAPVRFSIGYNHDRRSLGLLDLYRENIEAFYFPIPLRYLSTSRAIPQNSGYPKEIPEIIKKCNSLHIRSQLLLNASCDGSAGLEKKALAGTIDYIKKLAGMGLKSVIVVNPVYIREIKRLIPGIVIEASVNCYVKTVEHAAYLKDLGVEILNIDNDINRNIPLIKEIKNKTGLKIKLLLTEGCLRNCPFERTHWNFIAHHQDIDPKAELLPDTERWGLKFFLRNPARVFRSSFVPPDGLKYYTPFVDYFKISCRDSSTSTIEFRLKAYLNQDFSGNLLYLFDCMCLHPYFSYIDASALKKNNFFRKMLACADDCGACNYCAKLMAEAVITNSYFLRPGHPVRIEESRRAVKIYSRVLRSSPGDSTLYLGLARAYFHLREYAKAIKELRRAEEARPADAQINFLLSKCYRKTGRGALSDQELAKGLLKFNKD
jgi:collagenase-like PrtC family protease